jgi:hypothetical protein
MRNEEDLPTERELQDLVDNLNRLQIQVNDVTRRIQNVREQRNRETQDQQVPAQPQNRRNRRRPLQVEDRVVVTNKYKGRQGVTGTVTKVTAAQVRVQPDGGGDSFRIYKANVRLL